MAPPMQVAAPPKGSISVGWLWVSFLKSSSQGCLSPVHVHVYFHGAGVDLLGLVQLGELARLFQVACTARVAMSMRFTGLVLPEGLPGVQIFLHRPFPAVRPQSSRESMVVVKVVWRQWSDQ